MTTTREIALRLATHIATNIWAPEEVSIPIVFLDAITQSVELGDHPAVIVIPRNGTGLHRGNPEMQIEVVLAINSTALVSNAAAHAETPEGVIIYGSGGILDSVLDNLVNTIKKAEPGAILANMQIEYALDNLPMQYATITLGYKQATAYGDCWPNNQTLSTL